VSVGHKLTLIGMDKNYESKPNTVLFTRFWQYAYYVAQFEKMILRAVSTQEY
jgi:hypothetical protein